MAHPFRYFRKHQKAFLAVAAVIAMFVFVIGDAIFGYIGQGGGPSPNMVAASWKGGRLTAQELETLTQRRHFISQFLQTLMMTGAQQVMQEGGNPMPPTVPNFIIEPGTRSNDVIVNVVTTRILADQARKAGITISDDVINHYLKEISFRRVSDSEILAILRQIRSGDIRGLEEQLFAGLRELLLGNTFMTSYSANIRSVLPEQRWEDWRRINERISLEAAAIPVSDFVKEVPDPKESELLAFYEEHKNEVGHQTYLVMGAELRSADPGFKEPRRVRLNYLLGDVNSWSEKFKDSITEEEIADYYERNKRTQFVKSADTPVFDESLFDAELEDSTEESPAESTDESTSEIEDETSDEEVESVDEEGGQATEEATSQEPATEEPGTPQDTPAEEESDAPTSAGDGDDATEAPADQSGDASRSQRTFRLAAFQDAEDAAETTVTDETAVADQLQNPGDDVSSADSESSTLDSAVSTGETASAASERSGEESGDEMADDAAGEDEEVEYVPLDSVRDAIRLNLARDKAVVELKQVMDRVYGQLQEEYSRYGFAVVTARSEEKEIPAPPEALTNLKERATEAGLISEETVLLTRPELADTTVGKAADVQTQTRPVWYAAFDDLQLYEPMLAQDIDGNIYMVTKVEDVPEKVPALKDIRNEVVRAWKEREAAKLALKKAEEFAAAAEKAGDTLGTFFIGKPYEVITTDMFSWLTFGTTPADMQRGAKLGDAPPLKGIGPDFMAKAFELKEDEVAAMLNYDQSRAYVFRLDRREATPEELRALFLKEGNNWYGGQVMMLARLQSQQQRVLEEILKRVDFNEEQLEEFLRPGNTEDE